LRARAQKQKKPQQAASLRPGPLTRQTSEHQAGTESSRGVAEARAAAPDASAAPRGGHHFGRVSVHPNAPAAALSPLQNTGRPLDHSTRKFMEPRLGQDLGQVRVHTDERAADAASALGARAFTSGSDIVFSAGEYAPHTEAGRRLLSHELTHVMQQRAGVPVEDGISEPGDSSERHADQVAHAVAEGRTATPLLDAYRSTQSLGQTRGPVIQRQTAPPAVAPGTTAATTTTTALPSADELTTRLARCIGIWETNRGQNNPAPKESALDTVAGVHASMATIEQATTPYAISALKSFKELRDRATPPLTMKELNDAEARATAVNTLLKSVATASAANKKPDDFIKDNTDAITATGLSNADVKTMFSAVTLKSTIDTAHADAEEAAKTARQEAAKEKKSGKEQSKAAETAKKKSVTDSIAAINAPDRLGLGDASLKSYINKPANWGENRAGWQRKAVASMPNNIGTRIEAVSVLDSGTALATPVIKSRVSTELAKTPVPTEEEIVKTVAQQNNPGEKDYGLHVWQTYQRLYPAPQPAAATPAKTP
jgi:hypothetical protein